MKHIKTRTKVFNRLYVPSVTYRRNKMGYNQWEAIFKKVLNNPSRFDLKKNSLNKIQFTLPKFSYGRKNYGKLLLSKQRIKYMYGFSEKELRTVFQDKNSAKNREKLMTSIENRSNFFENHYNIMNKTKQPSYHSVKKSEEIANFLKNFSCFGISFYLNLIEKNLRFLHSYTKSLGKTEFSEEYKNLLISLKQVNNYLFLSTKRKNKLDLDGLFFENNTFILDRQSIKEKIKTRGRKRKTQKTYDLKNFLKNLENTKIIKQTKFKRKYITVERSQEIVNRLINKMNNTLDKQNKLLNKVNSVKLLSDEKNYVELLLTSFFSQNLKPIHIALRQYVSQLLKFVNMDYFPGHNTLTEIPNHMLFDASTMRFKRILSKPSLSVDQAVELENVNKSIR